MKIRVYINEFYSESEPSINSTTTVMGKEEAKRFISDRCEQLVDSEEITEKEADAIINEFEENDEIDVTLCGERNHIYFDRIIDTDEQ